MVKKNKEERVAVNVSDKNLFSIGENKYTKEQWDVLFMALSSITASSSDDTQVNGRWGSSSWFLFEKVVPPPGAMSSIIGKVE